MVSIAITVTIVAVVRRNSADSPKSVVRAFESAINSKDLDAVIKCFDPSAQNQFKAVSDIGGKIMEFDLYDIANGALFFNSVNGGSSSDRQWRIDIHKVKKNGGRASVYTTIYEYDKSGKIVNSEKETIQTVKISGKWYIGGSDDY